MLKGRDHGVPINLCRSQCWLRVPPQGGHSDDRVNLVGAVHHDRCAYEEGRAAALRGSRQRITQRFRAACVQIATMNPLVVPTAAVHSLRFVALVIPPSRVRDDRRQVHRSQRIVLRLDADGERSLRVVSESDEERPGAETKPDLLEHIARDTLQAVTEVRLKSPHELRDRFPHGSILSAPLTRTASRRRGTHDSRRGAPARP